ncbi:hypothetical protein GCM10011331_12250 [Flavimobilis marinus]|uniref:Putative pterin-4-alpha-carbinolamine dehydratase n=2 Tax=Flavimobilis marinus TaxID=285351 RepID=A0A1I2G832_9MICO|nr:hypothetical protein GCM10011331_12250 [Flavimobilis marinus]SFF12926.1 4a-hydroxytetrahydrobiopterin dehydratase [Flavimobilis marinus]
MGPLASRGDLGHAEVMTETMRHGVAQEAVGAAGWRVLLSEIHTYVPTGSYTRGLELVNDIARLAEDAGHHPDVTLRYAGVHVRLTSHDIGDLTQRDVDLALAITAAVRARGLETRIEQLAVTEIAIDALDIPGVLPFWQAALRYQADGYDTLVDPLGLGPSVWFQQMDAPRPERSTFHLDVTVPHDLVADRLAAVLRAGGTLLSDERAPAFWVLADPEGNEACLCTWQDRSTA